ncbi:MAG TPA: N,N-dimethylformamidase beta subunit family domain-containing protein, partial [Pyrinomonadaceae bacterium]
MFGKNSISDQYHSRHLVRAELWVFNWLVENGYAVDVYTDLDFHDGIDELDSYKLIVLACHPEYWSLQMMAELKNYLSAGGRLMCLSANDLYDAVDISEGFQTVTVYGQYGQGRERLFQQPSVNQPEYQVLGIGFHWDGDDSGNAISSRRPYKIVNSQHRFFSGTGLKTNDYWGYNGWS